MVAHPTESLLEVARAKVCDTTAISDVCIKLDRHLFLQMIVHIATYWISFCVYNNSEIFLII